MACENEPTRPENHSSTEKVGEPKSHDRICGSHFHQLPLPVPLSKNFDSRTRLGADLGLKYKATLKEDAISIIFEHRQTDQSTERGASARPENGR